MSAGLFRNALRSSNIQVSSNRSGDRSVSTGRMDMDRPRERGPRMIPDSYGNTRGSRGRGGRGRHDDDRSITERLGERMGYRGRGRSRSRFGNRGRGDRSQLRNSYSVLAQRGGSDRKRWYQVTVPYGAKADKEFILSNIRELMDWEDLLPNNFKYDGKAAVFFLEMTANEAEAMKSISKRVTMPDGYKMAVLVRPGEPPVPKVIEGPLLAKLMEVLSDLYDPELKVLNLAKLHANPDLAETPLMLNRVATLTSVSNIISEHIPDVRAINMSGNRLAQLDILSTKLVPNTPHMTALDLTNNEVRDSDVEKLKGWDLTEICLDNTPFYKRYDDKASLLVAVRKIFPKVVKLDGVEAPLPIAFDVAEVEAKLPEIKPGVPTHNPQVQTVISRFVEQYVTIFDSDSRQHLLPAYHSDAVLSLSYRVNKNADKGIGFSKHADRNLLRLENDTARENRLKKSNVSVVSQLSEIIPKTKHLIETLTLDVVMATGSMMIFTLSGIYEEVNPSRRYNNPRLFSRTFTAVPQGEGIVILSEMYIISNVTSKEKTRLIECVKNRTPAPSSLPVVSPPPTPLGASAVSPGPTSDAEKQSLVQQFMQQSGMNAHWAGQCLSANDYNYDKAAVMFANLKAENKLPPEAFITQA